MAAILDLVNFHRFKELEKMQSLFVLMITMFQMRIIKKITFNKHFARKYIRAYTKIMVISDILTEINDIVQISTYLQSNNIYNLFEHIAILITADLILWHSHD